MLLYHCILLQSEGTLLAKTKVILTDVPKKYKLLVRNN